MARVKTKIRKMPKIRVLSGLHLEFQDFKVQKLWRRMCLQMPSMRNVILPDNEILVLAGDTSTLFSPRTHKLHPGVPELFRTLRLRWSSIVVVAGNHEYYAINMTPDDIDAHLRAHAAAVEGVHFLQCSSVVLQGVKFLGCTLRSDPTPEEFAEMSDSEFVSREVNQRIHQEHRAWLAQELALCNEQAQPCVVVTHHLPTSRLRHPKFKKHGGYETDLDELIQSSAPALKAWICGHSHEAMRLRTDEGVQLVLNPLGYLREARLSLAMDCVIEVENILKEEENKE